MDLRIGLSFAGLLVASAVVMKAVSWWQCPAARRPPGQQFWLSPLFSVESLRRAQPVSRARMAELARRLASISLCLAAGYAAAPWVRARTPPWAWPYLALPMVPLYGGFAATFLQMAGAVRGQIAPDHHRRPWRSTSVADFWGREWNTWLSDWFRQIIFLPLRRRPMAAAFATFLFSGVWHEALIALPFFLWTGRALFGLLTSYFLLQFLGISAERALPRPARRAFFFLVVAGPCPLFLNQAMLRILLLWPGGGR